MENQNNNEPNNTPENEPDYNELSDLADAGELTEEKLQEELNKYAQALAQEFEAQVVEAPENCEEYTRDFFKKNLPAAAAQIVFLSNNAYSESVKLNAAKFVVIEALANTKQDGDPVKQFLKQLSNVPTAKISEAFDNLPDIKP